jgi:hypothetical protein
VNCPFTGRAYLHKRARRENIFPRAIRGLRSILAQFRRAAMLAGALALVAPLSAYAQSNAVRPRVTDRVDTSQLTVLSGNTHPLARAQYDQGAAQPNLPMDRMQLVLKRSAEQEAALQDLLEQQQVKSSPSYHKWLTPDQFGQQFGPADGDIQTVTSWLASFGFQAINVSRGRTLIEFSGTAAQVETALHTSIHRYVVNGESHWANASDPQIPAALAPVISGIVSLHDFRKKHLSVRSSENALRTVGPGASPAVTFSGGSHALGPADFGVIYNVAGSGMTGTGVTIGVIARTNISSVTDIEQFRSIFSLTPNDPQIVLNGPDPGVVNPDEEGEAVLDATWSGAVAPNATVKLVVSESTNAADGIFLSEFYIIDNNLADVMTESFISCEANTSSNEASAIEFVAEQAAAQGITYLVASGDGGPDSCDDQTMIPTTDAPASVNVLASTPFTIAVGGTEFDDTANPSQYWKATNGAGVESAISYIPENVWNESCTSNCGQLSIGLWSSGGGRSAIFPKPSWQAGVAGIPAQNSRFVPDVAVTAAGHDAYLVCLDGSCQGTGCPPGTPQCFAGFGGTSASVQAFGGIMALVVQKTGERQGQANYVIYKLAGGETLSSCNGSSTATLPISTCIFNDTTSGNTNIPGETGFTAGPGYDETTGLGSVNVTNLVNQWHTAIVNASTTTLTLNNSTAVNITHGQSVPVSITVAAKAPATGTPTGDVSIIAGSTTGQGVGRFTLTNGSTPGATTTLLPGSPIPGGSYSVTAHYAGDGTFLASDSAPVSVIVNPESSLTTLGIVTPTSNNAASVVYGSPYILAVQVTNSSGAVCNPSGINGPACPTGTVTLTDNGNPLDGVNGNFTLNSLGEFEDQPIQLFVGIQNIKAVYAGDNSFNGSTSSSDVVTVTQAPTTTSVSVSQTTVLPNTNVTITATIATQSNATADAAQEPNGTVQFFVNGTAFGAPAAVIGGVNSNTHFAQATASIFTTALAGGQNAITAEYLGDSNYAASAVSPSVTVTVTLPTVTTSSLPTGVVNAPYPSTQLAATGGAPPYTWTLTAGSLPTGLAPLPSTGVISGTPTATGTFHFTAQVRDSAGNTSTAALAITVNASLQVTTSSVPTDVDAGVPFASTTLTATGGVPPYTSWVKSSGSLPSGLSLSNVGVISGTPIATAVGTATFAVTVTDSQGNTATSANLTIAVSGFNFTAASTSPVTIASQGMSGTEPITLNVVNGFTGTATLTASVTGSPAGAVDLPAVTFTTPNSNFSSSNNTMTFSNAVATGNVTLNIATTAAAGATFRRPAGPIGRAWPLAAVSMIGFFFLLAAQKKRRWGFVPLVVLLAVVAVAGVSCGSSGGGGGGGGGGNPGTTTGSYTITVVATPSPGGAQGAQTAIIPVTVN